MTSERQGKMPTELIYVPRIKTSAKIFPSEYFILFSFFFSFTFSTKQNKYVSGYLSKYLDQCIFYMYISVYTGI